MDHVIKVTSLKFDTFIIYEYHKYHKYVSSIFLKATVDKESVSHFLGQCPATAQLRGKFFWDYYLSVNDIMDHYHITSVVNYTNYTRRLIEQEDLDHSGVT